MKLSSYIEKVESSPEFARFKQENPNSFLAAGFFVLDIKSLNNIEQIDYFIPEKNQIANFILESDDSEQRILFRTEQNLNKKQMNKLNPNSNLSLEQIQAIVSNELNKQKINEKLNKIISIIFNENKKTIWNLTCMLDNFKMLTIKVDDAQEKIIETKLSNLLEIVKK